MSLLNAVVMGGAPEPPKVVIYGHDGVGKTTFAASAPRPIVQRTEDGLKTVRVPTFPRIAVTYAEVMDGVHELATTTHPFQTYVLDSLTAFEPLVWAATCARMGWSGIEAPGYGKGYAETATEWRQFLGLLDNLRDNGMAVVLTGHAEAKRYNSPDTEPYDRYRLDLHESGADLVRRWADVVGFARWETFTRSTDVGFNKSVTRGVGTGARLLAVEERPAYHAKNRYQLPPEIPLSWAALEAGVGAALAAPAGLPDWLVGAEREERAVVAAVREDETDAEREMNEQDDELQRELDEIASGAHA